MNEGQFLRHGPCDNPDCGSSDACAVYTDHTYCFACQKHTNTDEDGEPQERRRVSNDKQQDLLRGEPFTTSIRAITPETYTFWRYTKGEFKGSPVHLANHYKDGQLIGQKVRFATKDFKVFGKMDDLYGRWLWQRGGKKVVITEGEIDALSVSQVQNNKWPVVSVPNGAQGALKAVKAALDWLETFEQVIFMFDQDEPGQKAAKECAAALRPGKAFIASLPLKDANEMLKAGRDQDIVRAIWNAVEFRPDGIVTMREVKTRAKQPVQWGAPWPFPRLTELTYGRRRGEVVYLGAGTGIGKTDFLTQCISLDSGELDLKVGVLFLEQAPVETAKRVAGKIAAQRFHVPDAGWDQATLDSTLDAMEERNNVFMYDNFGASDWDAVVERITYMASALGCVHIYLDHLTALAAGQEDEKVFLENATERLAGLAMRLNIWLFVVSHLTTPEKGSHEEGARVQIRQFKGSRAIGFWAFGMLGLERNQQSEDQTERNTTYVRILKDRLSGQSVGEVVPLLYDHRTGLLSERDDSFPSTGGAPGDDDIPF